MKISALNFKLLFTLLNTFAITSCGLFNGRNYDEIDVDHSVVNLNLVNNGSTSGNVIKPNDVTLTFTNSSLSKTGLNGHKYLPSPTVGEKAITIKVLVPLIHFSDSTIVSSYKRSIVEEKIKNAFEGVTPFLSVKEFYKNASNNLINFEFEYTDWFDAGSSSNCTDEKITFNIIDKAVKEGKIDGSAINTSDFDSNNDGYIDAVYAIYDVSNFKNTNSENRNLWAYTLDYTPVVGNKNNPRARNFSWASYDFLDEGYGEGFSDPHTLIHETGHLFGLYDYYDYNANFSPVCAVDMMDYNICDLNAYSKIISGWMKPYIVYGEATINLNEVKENNSCIVVLGDKEKLIKDKNTNKYLFNPFNEYMLVENFNYNSKANFVDLVSGYDPVSLVGGDSYTKSGYKIYHIDSPQLLIQKVKNSYTYDFYYSHKYVENKSSLLQNIMTNTSFGEQKRAESNYFEQLGIEKIDENCDYFNEITLIAKSTRHEINYRTLYTYIDENNEKKIEKASNDFLFDVGDSFIPSSYKNYFVHGGDSSSITFDNNLKFSTQINFN
ncbi:MAG: hypothetical protein IJ186_03670 [Bacilli bacterium]|nr:hypothetical protein [Bacilli bacterium]